MRGHLLDIIDKAQRDVGYELSEGEISFLRRSVQDSIDRRIYKFVRGARQHKTILHETPIEYLVTYIQEEIDDLQHYLDAMKEHYLE